MRLWVTACAVTLATLAASAQTAQASTMTWDFAELVARDYWQTRTVTLPCDPAPYLLTEKENAELQASFAFQVDMVADLAGCRVLITPVADWNRTHGMASNYCQSVVHEIGHLAGLDHAYGGVMESPAYALPFGCEFPRQWAVLQGFRQPPPWVRRSPARVQRLWLAGRVWRAQVARARWLESR